MLSEPGALWAARWPPMAPVEFWPVTERDPHKTARNKAGAQLRAQMDDLVPEVLDFTGCDSVLSLNAKIGGKHEQLCNVKERCIRTSDEFLSIYMDSLARHIRALPMHIRHGSAFYQLAKWYQTSKAFQSYTEKFLERSFLKHYDEYARVKPAAKDAAFWIGAKNADYGLLIAPRFRRSEWENDKSEIRRFKPDYFTIGHVLETGLVVPGDEVPMPFCTVEEYLKFFQHVLVRSAGSIHQNRVARRYAAFVRESDDPTKVPLLIPELRYRGRDKLHKHRLDFCVIDPHTLQKIGFELSPWSSHGHLAGTDKMLVKEVNAKAKANYEGDIKKCEAYFSTYGIHVTVFTDSDLEDPNKLFKQIKRYLKPEKRPQQLFLHSKRQLLEMDLDAEVEDE
jgi:hypothetical protein